MEKTASKRQLQVAREIQRHLSEIIRSKGMAAFDGAMVTVSEVRISPDLSFAKVFVSIFPTEKASVAMAKLEEGLKGIRGDLGRAYAGSLRIVPELYFVQDTSEEYAAHIEELLKK